jgi:hypothetical protein
VATSLVAPPIWMVSPNLLKCRAGHALVTHRAGFHVDQRRVDGHIFMACECCKPTTYFFGVVHSRPSPIVHCYAITAEQWQFWRNTTDDELAQPLEEDHETEDLLNRLGYNPGYQRKS